MAPVAPSDPPPDPPPDPLPDQAPALDQGKIGSWVRVHHQYR